MPADAQFVGPDHYMRTRCKRLCCITELEMATRGTIDNTVARIRASTDAADALASGKQLLWECFRVPDLYLSFELAEYALAQLRTTGIGIELTETLTEQPSAHGLMFQAQRDGVWDFSLEHPSMSVGLNGSLTLAELTAAATCFMPAAKQEEAMALTSFDVTLAQLLQHSTWKKALQERRVIVIPATATLAFREWLNRDPLNEMPPDTAAQQQLHFFLNRPNDVASEKALLLMPILVPPPGQHYVLAAFWWSRDGLHGAFFDSIWTKDNDYKFYKKIFNPFYKRLREVYDRNAETPLSPTLFPQIMELRQQGEGCGSTCLYFMHHLMLTTERTNDTGLVPTFLAEEVRMAFEKVGSGAAEALRRSWASETMTTNPEWKKRSEFLAKLLKPNNDALTASTNQWVASLKGGDDPATQTQEATRFFERNRDAWLRSTERRPLALGWLPDLPVITAVAQLASTALENAAGAFARSLFVEWVAVITHDVPDPDRYKAILPDAATGRPASVDDESSSDSASSFENILVDEPGSGNEDSSFEDVLADEPGSGNEDSSSSFEDVLDAESSSDEEAGGEALLNMTPLERGFFALSESALDLTNEGSASVAWLRALDYKEYVASRLYEPRVLDTISRAYPAHASFLERVRDTIDALVDRADALLVPLQHKYEPSKVDRQRLVLLHTMLTNLHDEAITQRVRDEATLSDALSLLVELLHHLTSPGERNIFSAKRDQVTSATRTLNQWERALTLFVVRVDEEVQSLLTQTGPLTWFQGELRRRLTYVEDVVLPGARQMGLEVQGMRQLLLESLVTVANFDDFFLRGTNLVRGNVRSHGILDGILAQQGRQEKAKAEEYFRRLGDDPLLFAKEVHEADDEGTYIFALSVVILRARFLRDLYAPATVDVLPLPRQRTLELKGLQKFILIVDEDARQAAADFQATMEDWGISERALVDGQLGRFVLRLMSSWLQSELSDKKSPIDSAFDAEDVLTVVGDALEHAPQATVAVFNEVRAPWLDTTRRLRSAIRVTMSELRGLQPPTRVLAFKASIGAYNTFAAQYMADVVRAVEKTQMWTTWLFQLNVHIAGMYNTENASDRILNAISEFDALPRQWEQEGADVEDHLIWGGLFRLLLPHPPAGQVWDLAAIQATLPAAYANPDVVDVRYLTNAGILKYPLYEFLPPGTELPAQILAKMRVHQADIHLARFEDIGQLSSGGAPRFAEWLPLRARWTELRAMVEALLFRLPFVRAPREFPDLTPADFLTDTERVLMLSSPASILQTHLVASLSKLGQDPTKVVDIPPEAAALPRGTLFQDPEPQGWILSTAQVNAAVAFMNQALAQYQRALTQRLAEYETFRTRLETLQAKRELRRGQIHLHLPITSREAAIRGELGQLPPLDTLPAVLIGRQVVHVQRVLGIPGSPTVMTEPMRFVLPVLGQVGTTEITSTDIPEAVASLETFAEQTDREWTALRQKAGPIGKMTYTQYEREVTRIREELTARILPFQDARIVIPIPVTALGESMTVDILIVFFERLWRASETVAAKLRDVEDELRQVRMQVDRSALESAPGVAQHLDWIAAKWTIPNYEDEGDVDRPKWRLAQPGTPGAEKSWAAFGGARPTLADEALAATLFSAGHREEEVEAERRRLGPILREEAEYAKRRDLYLLSRGY